MTYQIMNITKFIPAIIGFVTLTVNAASFDCGKAGTNIEKQICANEQLSHLDEDLARKYKIMMASTDDGQKNALKKDQKIWLAQRNGCSNSACIEEAYSSRIKDLCQNTVLSRLDECRASDPGLAGERGRDTSSRFEATSPQLQNLNITAASENIIQIAAPSQNKSSEREIESQQSKVHSSDINISSNSLEFINALSDAIHNKKKNEYIELLSKACDHIKNNEFINRYVKVTNEMFQTGVPVDNYFIPNDLSNLSSWVLDENRLLTKAEIKRENIGRWHLGRIFTIKIAIAWCLIREKDSDLLRAFYAYGSLEENRKEVNKIIGLDKSKRNRVSLDANGNVIDEKVDINNINPHDAARAFHSLDCSMDPCPTHLYALFMPNGPEVLKKLASPVLDLWENAISAHSESQKILLKASDASPARKLVIKGLHLDMTAQQLLEYLEQYAETHRAGNCNFKVTKGKNIVSLELDENLMEKCNSDAIFVLASHENDLVNDIEMIFPFFNAGSVSPDDFAENFYPNYKLDEVFNNTISYYREAKVLSNENQKYPNISANTKEENWVIFVEPIEELNEYCIKPDDFGFQFKSTPLSLWCYSKLDGIELMIIPSTPIFNDYKHNTVKLRRVKTLNEVNQEKNAFRNQRDQAINNMKLD